MNLLANTKFDFYQLPKIFPIVLSQKILTILSLNPIFNRMTLVNQLQNLGPKINHRKRYADLRDKSMSNSIHQPGPGHMLTIYKKKLRKVYLTRKQFIPACSIMFTVGKK